jgi:hypothetical protein
LKAKRCNVKRKKERNFCKCKLRERRAKKKCNDERKKNIWKARIEPLRSRNATTKEKERK